MGALESRLVPVLFDKHFGTNRKQLVQPTAREQHRRRRIREVLEYSYKFNPKGFVTLEEFVELYTNQRSNPTSRTGNSGVSQQKQTSCKMAAKQLFRAFSSGYRDRKTGQELNLAYLQDNGVTYFFVYNQDTIRYLML